MFFCVVLIIIQAVFVCLAYPHQSTSVSYKGSTHVVNGIDAKLPFSIMKALHVGVRVQRIK